MKRRFVYQDAKSDKFWDIEFEGTTQTVVYGKTGTAGREAVKEFATAEECIKESEKLIAQKLKKGYTELAEGEAAPEKREYSEEEKADYFFWEAIEKSYKYNKKDWEAYDLDEHIEKLTTYLSKYSEEKLILFEKTLQQKLISLYTAPIAELSIILENEYEKEGDTYNFDGYISDDGFIYFRCWLLLKGKEFYDDITKDIESFVSGKYHFDIGDTWGEGLLYVASRANSEARPDSDEDIIRDTVYEKWPEINYDSGDFAMDREPKSGGELQKMYPKLVAEIMPIR
jgi:WGR domain protein